MKRMIFTMLAAFAAYSAAATENGHVKVSAEDILFQSDFNADLTPGKGQTDGMIRNAEITSGGKGFPFKDGAPSNEALNTVGGKYLVLPASENYDARRGTLQFLIKPMWRKTGYVYCVPFKLVFDKQKRSKLEWSGVNSFVVEKTDNMQGLRCFQDANNTRNIISKEIPYSRTEWHGAAVTWDIDSGKRKFYIDGELVGTAPWRKMTQEPLEFMLGSPGAYSAEAYLDEIRILNRVLTPAEIKQDHTALFNGYEFPKISAQKNKSFLFEPVAPEKKNANTGVFSVGNTFRVRNLAKDGFPGEAEWKRVKPVGSFVNRLGKQASTKTEVKLLRDSKNIHLLAVMHEPEMNKLAARFDQNDLDICSDDCLELFIDTDGNSGSFYQIAINALGSIYDSKNGEKSWNLKNKTVKTSRESDRWIIKMSLPYSDFGKGTPADGEFWGIRFCRERHHETKELSSVPKVPDASFNQRAFLGKLIFEGTESDSTVSISCDAGSFLPGTNSVALTAVNSANVGVKGKIKIGQIDASGRNSVIKTLDLILNPKETRTEKIVIPVTNDTTERLSLKFTDSAGKSSGGVILNRGFETVPGGIAGLEKELNELEKTLPDMNETKHPQYQGARESIALMRKGIKEYQSELAESIRGGRTVSGKTSDAFAALANGFRIYREKNRVLIWPVSLWETGAPNALPPMNVSDRKMSLNYSVAGNEREALAFAVSGFLCGKRLDLRIVPRSIFKPEFISCDNFEVYYEPFVEHRSEKITAPLIRAPGNIVTVTPGETLRVWVMFNSRGVSPGKYSGAVDLKPLNDYAISNRTIPVSVKVWNFTLPETRDWPLDCYFWTGQTVPLDETPLLKLMHAYHVKWTMTEAHHYKHGFINDRRWFGKGYPERSHTESVLKTGNEEFLREAKRLGMKIVFAWGCSGRAEWYRLMCERMTSLGFDSADYIFHGGLRDEFQKKDIPHNAKLRDQLKKELPDTQFLATYLSTPPPSGATLEDIGAAHLPEFFKYWAVISDRIENQSTGKKTIKYFRDRGGKVWMYQCQLNMQIRPVFSYYRFFPWKGYLYGLDGVAFWSSYEAAGDDGFDNRDGYDDGITWRGLDKAPVTTKRLEAVREGLEDVAYMHLLKKTLAAAKKKAPGTEFGKYEKLLTMTAAIVENCSETEVAVWRQNVGEAIDELVRNYSLAEASTLK